ncbi:M56 family metallopeptidase [Thalassolituus sp. ST750PaO-4]|uniref:M56 family metallopeptidase n=1 Tax=Thalassolituus sp. ST750PaO-4 TaxID=2742965 RepID=UPI001CE347A7|nr:M56 family metallopeptidase [Thalassolituus sp. ST750PaO-4]MCA6058556.1 M56 family metallopeptidase [Thalassolituus sp. ST750PaO-4]
MTPELAMIPELADILLASAFSLTASSVLAALLLPLLQKTLRNSRPQQQSRLLMLYALLPWVVTFWVVFLLMNPGLTGALHSAHCHGQLCGPHVPDVSSSSLTGAVLAGVVSALLLFALLLFNHQLRRGRQRLASVDLLSTAGSTPSNEATIPDFRLIHSPLPLAWCAGLWRPRIYLSSALQQQLTPQQSAMVLLHEHCHLLCRDNLRKFLLYWASLLWLPKARKALQEQFALNCELQCDAYVTRQGYAPEELATLLQQLLPQTDMATQASGVRIQALLPEKQITTGSSADGWLLLVLLLCAQVALFSHWLHPLLDTLFL